jgi:hypothetical protein
MGAAATTGQRPVSSAPPGWLATRRPAAEAAAGRPIVVTFRNGMEGQDPSLAVMERWDAAAARFGEALGLTPMSERRLGRIGLPGRPMGAASAPDRVPRVLRAIPRVVTNPNHHPSHAADAEAASLPIWDACAAREDGMVIVRGAPQPAAGASGVASAARGRVSVADGGMDRSFITTP